MELSLSCLPRLLRKGASGCCAGLLLLGGAAQAALSGDVTVTLAAPGGIVGIPTPLLVTQVAPLATGIVAGGGGPVASYMLDGESITFVGDSIHLQTDAGAQLGNGSYVTGYLGSGPVHASYTLDNLDISGRQITGYTVTAFDGFGASGNIGLISAANASTAVHLLTPHSLSVDLDTLIFQDRGLGGGYNYADIRIDLISTVPEPGTALLALCGGGLLLLLRARTRRPC